MRSTCPTNGRLARGAVFALSLGACALGHTDESRRVMIPAGATLAVAADTLRAHGLIAFPNLFRVYAKLTHRDRALKAGTYAVRPGASWETILRTLVNGGGLVRTITIPEGFALNAIEPLLVRVMDVPAESVSIAVADSASRADIGATAATLEGYLFPDTYAFPEGTSARLVVRAMVQRFEAEWDSLWTARLDTLRMSRNEIVTLASIIEKETYLAAERPIISAVYHNRLRQGMLLQADPTVQYARGAHAERLLSRDLEIESPYNTYRHLNLPPGPIASPGRASIEAALYPDAVPFLYFVAMADGHHEFRRTFAEHLEAKRRAQRGRVAKPPAR